MVEIPKYRIMCDLNNRDEDDCVRLNCIESLEAIKNMFLRDNLDVIVYDEDDIDEIIEVDGILKKTFINKENTEYIWVAKVDWKTLKRIRK